MARHAPAALLAVLTICGTLSGVARPLAQGATQSAPIPYGKTKLGLSVGLRDGALYVPKSYRDETPMPVMVMLHGYSGWGDELASTFALAEEFGVVIVAPDTRDVTSSDDPSV